MRLLRIHDLRRTFAVETASGHHHNGALVLEKAFEARAVVAEHGGEAIGRLRVSAPLAFGVLHIAPILADLAKRHPRLELDISFSDRIVDLIGDHFDMAVRIGELRDSSLVARRIATTRSVLVASAGYLARKGQPQTPADLAAHEFLIYNGRSVADTRLRAGRRWVTVRPRGRLATDNGETLLQWTAAGLGIAEVPSFLVSDMIEAGLVAPLLPDYPGREVGIFVVRPPGMTVPAKVRSLTDLLAERLGGRPVWDRCMTGPDT